MSDNELLAPGTTGLGGRRSGATTPDDQNPRRGGSGYGDVTPVPPVDPSTDPRSAGLVRPRRRVVNGSEKKSRVGAGVVRNYQVVDEVVFTNYSELRNDMMSSAFAQEVLESFFVSCDIDLTNPKAATMAEDVVLTFYIQNAASQKTAHDLVVDIYGKELDMMVLLRLLVSHEQTPRRFTRGLADRIFEFLKKPENEPLRVSVAAAHSLEDPKYATIAFDGSTHVTDLPPDYRSVANMLMSRGIFDNYAAEKSRSESATYDAVTRSAGVRSGQAGLTRT